MIRDINRKKTVKMLAYYKKQGTHLFTYQSTRRRHLQARHLELMKKVAEIYGNRYCSSDNTTGV
jgi:hypothetical protein